MFRGISTGDVDHNGQVNPPPRITPTGCRGIVIAAFVVKVCILCKSAFPPRAQKQADG